VQARLVAPVRVDNDANMAALGERWMGVARSASHFVFLALGAGVGAGVMIDGRLHRGHHWYAGEICRMTLDYREWQVDYGERGYLESRIGAAAIPEWAHARSVLARAGREGEAAMQTIFSAAAAGDPEANDVVGEIAVYLGSAIANIVSVLDPSLVVFGGGLSHAGEVLIEPVRRVVSRIVPNVPTLAISSLGDDAQLLGSVYSAMELAEAKVAAIAGSARRV
jgi:predicted NBD/HSP70 family sugar kinase